MMMRGCDGNVSELSASILLALFVDAFRCLQFSPCRGGVRLRTLLEAPWHEMEAPGSKMEGTVPAAAPPTTSSLPLALLFVGGGRTGGRSQERLPEEPVGSRNGARPHCNAQWHEPGRLPQVPAFPPQGCIPHRRLFYEIWKQNWRDVSTLLRNERGFHLRQH